jgi:hypothetical protein
LVCLLLSTPVFDLKESPMFKRVPGGAKSTESSSKSSSTEGRARWAKLRSRAEGGGFPNRRSYGTHSTGCRWSDRRNSLPWGERTRDFHQRTSPPCEVPIRSGQCRYPKRRNPRTRGTLCRRARASPRRTQSCPAVVATHRETHRMMHLLSGYANEHLRIRR